MNLIKNHLILSIILLFLVNVISSVISQNLSKASLISASTSVASAVKTTTSAATTKSETRTETNKTVPRTTPSTSSSTSPVTATTKKRVPEILKIESNTVENSRKDVKLRDLSKEEDETYRFTGENDIKPSDMGYLGYVTCGGKRCTASLVTANFMITGATCLASGTCDIAYIDSHNPVYSSYSITKQIIHPDFKASNRLRTANIGLVKLGRPVDIGAEIKLVKLGTKSVQQFSNCVVFGYDFKNEGEPRSKIANIQFEKCDYLKSQFQLYNNESAHNICKKFAVAEKVEVLAPFNMFHLIGTDDEALPVFCGDEQFGIMSNVLGKEGVYFYDTFWTLTASYLRWIGNTIQENRETVPEEGWAQPDIPGRHRVPFEFTPETYPSPAMPNNVRSQTNPQIQALAMQTSKLSYRHRRYTCPGGAPEKKWDDEILERSKNSAGSIKNSILLLCVLFVKHLIVI